MSKHPFVRIEYASFATSTQVISPKQKEEILSVAVEENNHHGITGVLICIKNMFFQIIEGETTQVEQLYKNIKKDRRHFHVTCLVREGFCSESDRLFPNWEMKSLDSNDGGLSGQVYEKALTAFRALLGAVFQTHSIIGRYTQPAVANLVKMGENPLDFDPVIEDKVIMFVELVSYFMLTESITRSKNAPDVMVVLNMFFDCISETVEEFGGEVGYIQGESVLIYFPGDAIKQAVNCSKSINEKLDQIRQAFDEIYQKAMFCAIGMSKGEVLVGNVGSKKLEFSIMGDAVNTAARIKKQASKLKYTVLVDETISKHLPTEQFTQVGYSTIKGGSQSIAVFAVDSASARIPEDFKLRMLSN